MGPRPHMWICVCKAACLSPDLQVSLGPRPRLRICACKTTSLAQVWMNPSSHLWFSHTKQRD